MGHKDLSYGALTETDVYCGGANGWHPAIYDVSQNDEDLWMKSMGRLHYG